jgi:hypothetical protein
VTDNEMFFFSIRIQNYWHNLPKSLFFIFSFAFLNRVLAGIGTGDSSIEVFWLSNVCSHCKNFSQVLQLI